MNVIKVLTSVIFPLITFPYISRILGPEGVGRVNFANSFVAYFVLMASVGIPMYGIREVAKVRDDRQALSELVQELLLIHCCATLAVGILFIAVAFSGTKTRNESELFIIVSFSIPLALFAMEWLYQGLEEYAYITIRSMVISALCLIALFVLVHQSKDYLINAAILVMATMGSSILNFWNARKIVFAKRSNPFNLRRHIGVLPIVYAYVFITSFYCNLDVVMLGYFSTPRNIGYYTGAMKFIKVFSLILASLGGVVLPRLSWYLANAKMQEFDRTIEKSLSIILFLCLPVFGALEVLGREIIFAVVGQQYADSILCLRISAPIVFFVGMTGVLGVQILYPLGNEKKAMISVGCGAAVSLVANLILIPRFAHFGAAWGTMLAEGAVFAAQIALVRSVHRVPWPWRSVRRYLMGTIAMVCVLFAIGVVSEGLKPWIQLLIQIPVGSMIYFVILLITKEAVIIELLGKLLVLRRRLIGLAS